MMAWSGEGRGDGRGKVEADVVIESWCWIRGVGCGRQRLVDVVVVSEVVAAMVRQGGCGGGERRRLERQAGRRRRHSPDRPQPTAHAQRSTHPTTQADHAENFEDDHYEQFDKEYKASAQAMRAEEAQEGTSLSGSLAARNCRQETSGRKAGAYRG